jgi:hypothetical protein
MHRPFTRGGSVLLKISRRPPPDEWETAVKAFIRWDDRTTAAERLARKLNRELIALVPSLPK